MAATNAPLRLARALTIAGSDSGGGAGIQADIKTFCAFGVYGTSALTAVTAQNTLGVTEQCSLPPSLVLAQIDAVRTDLGVDATKTGMLATGPTVLAVARAIAAGGLGPVVVDPVMTSKHGAVLLDEAAHAALRDELLPLAAVLTPNLPEAAVLLGCDVREFADPVARVQAAWALRRLGPAVVVLKGGHAEALGTDGAWAIDLVCDGQVVTELRGPRWRTRHTHGTGCAFSAAIAAGLAAGQGVPAACSEAKAFISRAIGHAPGLGAGDGPIDLLPPPGWRGL